MKRSYRERHHPPRPHPALLPLRVFHFQVFYVYSGPMKGALNLWEVFQELVNKPIWFIKNQKKQQKKPSRTFYNPSRASMSRDATLEKRRQCRMLSPAVGLGVGGVVVVVQGGAGCLVGDFFFFFFLKSDRQRHTWHL